MTEKEMMLDVLNRLKRSTETAIELIGMDLIRDNENPKFNIPGPYQMRIGEFLVTDEKTKLVGNIATQHCKKLTT